MAPATPFISRPFGEAFVEEAPDAVAAGGRTLAITSPRRSARARSPPPPPGPR